MLRKWMFGLLITLLPLAGSFAGTVFVSARFLQTNPQIFPVGDLVDIETIENDEDIDMETLPDLFEVVITSTDQEELDGLVILHVTLDVNATRMVDFWSDPFVLREWVESPYGRNGHYSNKDLGHLENESWFSESNDPSRPTEYSDVEEFLELLDGSNLNAGIYTVRLEVYRGEAGQQDQLLGTFADNTQIYNPRPPQLQDPPDGTDVTGMPVTFTWEWSGGGMAQDSWKLVVVEGMPGEDGETVISSRNMTNTRYADTPQLPDAHNYTGFTGTEQALEDGKTYYWQVVADVNTVIPGDSRNFSSNIASFTFHEPTTASSAGSGSGGAEGATGGGSVVPSTEQQEIDPIVDMLSNVLPAQLVEMLYRNLEGYNVDEILIDGATGFTAEEIMRLLNDPAVSIITVELEEN